MVVFVGASCWWLSTTRMMKRGCFFLSSATWASPVRRQRVCPVCRCFWLQQCLLCDVCSLSRGPPSTIPKDPWAACGFDLNGITFEVTDNGVVV